SLAANSVRDISNRVAPHHFHAKLGEALRTTRRTGMVRLDALRFRSETKSQGNVKLLQCAHLAVEPFERPRPQAVGPAQAGPDVSYPQLPQPSYCIMEPMIIEMEPLANADRGSVAREVTGREFRNPVLSQQPHMEVAIVGRALRFAVTCGRWPGTR